MNTLERYMAMEAGLRLRRKLGRENPGISTYGGFFISKEGAVLTVYSSKPLKEVPKEWAGYKVHHEVK